MSDLRLLRHFEAVYRLMSFSAAAEELGLTHSALTKSVKTLEAEWGSPLFQRTTRSVAATEAAKKLYPQVIELLALLAGIRRSITAEDHEVNVVSGPVVIETKIHPAIMKFAQRYPKARINVFTMPPHLAAEELMKRRVDLLVYDTASIGALPHRSHMQETNLFDEPYWMVSRPGHPFLAHPHSLEELVRYDWALAGYDLQFEQSLPKTLQKIFRDNSMPRYRLLSQTACIELAKQSDILTAAPQSVAQAACYHGQVVAQPLPGNFRFSIIAATLRESELKPAIEHFIECL